MTDKYLLLIARAIHDEAYSDYLRKHNFYLHVKQGYYPEALRLATRLRHPRRTHHQKSNIQHPKLNPPPPAAALQRAAALTIPALQQLSTQSKIVLHKSYFVNCKS